MWVSVRLSGQAGTSYFICKNGVGETLFAGYIDTWDWSNKHTDDFTCCFDESVSISSDELYERIDHILLLEQGGFFLDEARVVITGGLII